MVFLNTPGSSDMITLNEDPEEAKLAGVNGGVAHFGFALTDPTELEAAIAEIEAAGGKLVERGQHGASQPFAYVADPDGYVIEI
jgi:catechol 2,3-dioxygenase-like lactoylglutathione lyase family enzyme